MLGLVFLFLGLGGIHLILIPRDNYVALKKVALDWSLITLAATILLWASFGGDGQFQAIFKFKWIPAIEPIFGSVVFAVDGVSIFFLILTALLVPICILISWNSIRFLIKEFLLCLLLMEILLMGVFTILDLVGFYILFEGILIPMFLIIGI